MGLVAAPLLTFGIILTEGLASSLSNLSDN